MFAGAHDVARGRTHQSEMDREMLGTNQDNLVDAVEFLFEGDLLDLRICLLGPSIAGGGVCGKRLSGFSAPLRQRRSSDNEAGELSPENAQWPQ